MEKTAVEWFANRLTERGLDYSIEDFEQAKEMESKQRFEHQLFIGKVTCIIGFNKTLELINESKLEILSFEYCKKNNN